MLPQGQAEEAIVSSFNLTERDDGEDEKSDEPGSGLKNFLWHGGSVYDAWFSCASNQVYIRTKTHPKKNPSHMLLILGFYFLVLQVAQVLLTLPYSFSQMGMLSGIILQVFYGLLGSWTAYLISILYVEYRSRKEKENASFKNHVIQVSFS